MSRARGATFGPRTWWLPQSRVLVTDVLGHPRSQSDLDGVRFTP